MQGKAVTTNFIEEKSITVPAGGSYEVVSKVTQVKNPAALQDNTAFPTVELPKSRYRLSATLTLYKGTNPEVLLLDPVSISYN